MSLDLEARVPEQGKKSSTQQCRFGIKADKNTQKESKEC